MRRLLPRAAHAGSAREVLAVALRLGLTAFGGPVAHLAWFERVYVREKGWLTHGHYAALVAFCQVLPGPTSSQVGLLLGLHRAGWRGALAAGTGFTLPSAALMCAAALAAASLHGALASGIVHGLKLAAVAVVAQAVYSMARRLCTNAATAGIALAAAAFLLFARSSGAQLAVLAVAALAGRLLCRAQSATDAPLPATASLRAAQFALGAFIAGYAALAGLAALHPDSPLALAAVFYRAGTLVFGGGHVVLPLLESALVPAGWVSQDDFLAGYGLAQAVPGPLFTIAAFLGARALPAAAVAGAALATAALFLPGMLLAVAGLPWWTALRKRPGLGAALAGVNAAVVGVLAAALAGPVLSGAVHDLPDALVALGGLVLLALRMPPLAVVAACALGALARVLT